jgi:hypothetical protein
MSTAIYPEVWNVIQTNASMFGGGWQAPAMTIDDYGFQAPEDSAFVKNKSTPQSLACFTEPLSFAQDLHQRIPSVYIHCDQSNFLSNMEERSKKLGIPYQTICAGHFVMIDAPEFLASQLQSICSKE